MVGTPLQGIKVPLTTVLEVVFLSYCGKHGLTAAELSRWHDLNYSTALSLKHRLQLWMGLSVSAFKFADCIVQADETYVPIGTGLGPGIKLNPGLGSQRQKPIISLVEDGGQGRAKTFVVNHVNEKTMKKIFEENVDTSATVYTDGNPVYHFLSDKGYLHFSCDHSKKIYSRNGVNVNTAEGLHSVLKSKILHVHRGVTELHLQKYADEITWLFMNRNRTAFDAINSLFEALPPLHKKGNIEPNHNFRK